MHMKIMSRCLLALCTLPLSTTVHAAAVENISVAPDTMPSTTAHKKDDKTNSMLPEVTVSAPRLSETDFASGTTLNTPDFITQRVATGDTASLLRDVPGVSMIGSGGVSSLPVVHGLADDRLRVQVDGMNLISACANHMNPPLSYMDPSNVGSIKIFSGVSPVSVGGDSLGSTIQVNSPAPEFAMTGEGTLLKGQTGTFYRSNGNSLGGNASATVASDKLSMMYSGSIVKSGNYKAAESFKPSGLAATDRGWLGGDVVGSSRYEAQNHELGFAVRNDGHLLELKLGLQHTPYQGFPNQRMDMTLNDNVSGNLRYTGKYQWGTLEARIYDEHTRHRMDFAEDKQFLYGGPPTPPHTVALIAPGMPMNTDGKNLGGILKGDITISQRDTFRVGVEAQRYRMNDWWPPSPATLPVDTPAYTMGGMAPDTFWNINNGKRDRLGAFSEWEARWSPQWITQLGLREDTVRMNTGTVQGYNAMMYGDPTKSTSIPGAFNAANRERTDNNWDFTASARYIPEATHTFEAGYAHKTRSPNLYERYAWSNATMAMEMVNLAGDGNYYIGNLNLKPEEAHTFSATADWHDDSGKRWGVKATPYLTYVQDYIDAQRCPKSLCAGNAMAPNTPGATTGFVFLQFVNQSARIYGLDLSGFFPLTDNSDYGSLTATGALNYTRGENRTTGDNLYDIMPLNGKLAVVHKKGKWTNTIEEQLVAAKTDVSQVRDEVKTGGYGLLNWRSSYEWDNIRLDVGVENILDKFYDPPLGGAYVGQGATMSGGAIPWGTPVPGPGRSVFAGLSAKF